MLAGYGIALPVGAVSAYLVALTARTSLRVGAAAAMGVASADGLYALLAVLGGTALASAIRPVAVPLRWVSVVVLVTLALWVAGRAVLQACTGALSVQQLSAPPSPVRAYVSLVAITVINPLTVVYFAALVLGSRTGVTTSVAEQAVFVGAAFAASASWQLALACGGAMLGRMLTGPRGRLFLALSSSVLIVILAAMSASAPHR